MSLPAKRLPIGIQSFEKLQKNECVYADKTKLIYDLVNQGSWFFLSRPRRFGKSLLCSTLRALFEGRRDLFENTLIAQSDWKWAAVPVIHVSFSSMSYESVAVFKTSFNQRLDFMAEDFGVDVRASQTPGDKIMRMLELLGKKQPIVLIVDEYDKPLIDNLTNKEVVGEIRDILRDFYDSIKNSDEYLRFVFITGVTKISKVSIFSDMNNLEDISMVERYQSLCGYTLDQIHENFSSHITEWADAEHVDRSVVIQNLQEHYNGYCFGIDFTQKVFNPYSVLLALSQKKLKNYWFESGTPLFLTKVLREQLHAVERFESLEISESEFESADIDFLSIKILLYQTGYLTIKSYNKTDRTYVLGYPNAEVAHAFINKLMFYVGKLSESDFSAGIRKIRLALQSDDIELFVEQFNHMLSMIPFMLFKRGEAFYQTIFFLICQAAGFKTRVEVATALGSIDAMIEFGSKKYIFEFKIDDSAKKALEQIKRKEYYRGFLAQATKQQLVLVGVSFDTVTRQINEYEIERMNTIM